MDSEGSKLVLNAVRNNNTLKVLKVLGSVNPYTYMIWSLLCDLI